MQTNTNKYKLNKKIYTLIALGILMMSLILLLSYTVASRFNNSHEIWKDNIYNEVMISEALDVLNKNIGYGWFIHKLKNVIIRRDVNR